MDRFDRGFRWFMVGLCFVAGILGVFRFHSPTDILKIVPVIALLTWHFWTSIPTEARKRHLLASLCGDNTGPENRFCTLEPGHPGDHKSFHSSGGLIGWRQKGGA